MANSSLCLATMNELFLCQELSTSFRYSLCKIKPPFLQAPNSSHSFPNATILIRLVCRHNLLHVIYYVQHYLLCKFKELYVQHILLQLFLILIYPCYSKYSLFTNNSFDILILSTTEQKNPLFRQPINLSPRLFKGWITLSSK